MTNKTISISFIGVIAILLLSLCVGAAQTSSATLQGTITDPTGRAIPQAKVKAQATNTGLVRETVGDEAGFYVLNFLPVGKYTVTVEVRGFKTANFPDIVLEVGQTRTLDIKLEVGQIEESVEVVSAPVLDQNSPTIGMVVEGNQIKELPINGRHWASLMLLAPGAINTGEGNQQSIRFTGRARDDNNWTLDGVDATGVKDPRQETAVRLVVSMDSISEFRVNTALYSADAGGGAGGNVQLISRGGTNKFRGSVFEFVRNDIFDARVFTDSTKLPFRLNQFGGNFGGPIRKDRTFFFINYEGIRQSLQQTIEGAVPSAAFRANVLKTSPSLAPVVNAYPIGTIPTTSAEIDNVRTVRANRIREDAGALRFDHQLSDRSSLMARYNFDDALVQTARDAGIGLQADHFRPASGSLQMQRLFSPTVVNVAKLGVNRSPLTRILSGPLAEQISVSGFMTLNRNQEVVESGTSFALLDDLAITRGKHNLKIGGEIRRIHVNVGEGEPVTLTYTSRPNFVANKLGSFNIDPFPVRGGRRWYYFAYVQDDLKLRPNLTLNLGARYEYYSVAVEVKDRARVFDLACGGFCPPGTPWYNSDKNNIAPRLGIAWSPKALKDRTVIRAGFGIFYGPGQVDDVFAAIDSSADRISLDNTQNPNLSYPITPFLAQARTAGKAPRVLQRDRSDLYSENYGLSIQQQLPMKFVLQVGYIGTEGHNLFVRSFTNVINPVTGQRPLPTFSKLDMKRNDGNSNFNALQVSVNRQFSGGFLMGLQYMWSHSINEGGVGGGEADPPQNVNNRRGDRGNSVQDIRHTFTTNWVYELPFGRGGRFFKEGIAEKVLGGWELSGIVQARTGRQLTVSITRAAGDVPDGNVGTGGTNGSVQRPDLVPGVSLIPPGGQSADLWINPAAFKTPAKGTWGNAGRSLLTGPGLVQFDVGVTRRFRIVETRNVEFRWEAFNVFNRTQLGNPNTNLSAGPNFGRITAPFNRLFGTGTNRQMQFSLRLNF
jgi:hypothetical protein